MNPKSLFSTALVLLLGSGLSQPFNPAVPEARADEAVALIQLGETGPTLVTTETSAFLAELSPYRWHTFYGGDWEEYGYGIAIAGDGSVYIAGYSFTSWLGDGGAVPLHLHSGYLDLFVLKLDSEGAYQWHTFYGSDDYEGGRGIAVGGDGSVYITGHSDTSWLGDGGVEPLHPHSGLFDLFVLKLDSQGAYHWHTFYGGEFMDDSSGIAVGGDGSVYIAGYSQQSWLGDGGAGPLHPFNGYQDLTVLKLDSQGAYQWHTFYGADAYGFGLAIAGDGSVYITGHSNTSWLGDGDAEPLHPHSGLIDLLVLKVDSQGAYQWHTFYGGDSWDNGTSIAISRYGSVYITGYSYNSWLGDGGAEPLHPHSLEVDITVLKLDSQGAYQWHTFYGGELGDGGSGIALAEDGGVYITGRSDTSWLGDGGVEPLHPHSGGNDLIVADLFVLKLVSQGAYQWHTFYGGESVDNSSGIAVGGDGSVYITGSSPESWLGDGDAEPLHSGGGAFVLKLVQIVQIIDQTQRIYLPLLSRQPGLDY